MFAGLLAVVFFLPAVTFSRAAASFELTSGSEPGRLEAAARVSCRDCLLAANDHAVHGPQPENYRNASVLGTNASATDGILDATFNASTGTGSRTWRCSDPTTRLGTSPSRARGSRCSSTGRRGTSPRRARSAISISACCFSIEPSSITVPLTDQQFTKECPPDFYI